MTERKIDIEKNESDSSPLLVIREKPSLGTNGGGDGTINHNVRVKPADLQIPTNRNLSHLFSSDSTSIYSSQESNPNTPNVNKDFLKRRRSDRRLRRLNTELLEAIEAKNAKWVEVLIAKGANPNATCRKENVSACHMASIMGLDEVLKVLLASGAERNRVDCMGRTPLHLAIWGGHVKCVAMLLYMPAEIIENLDEEHMIDFKNEGCKEKYREFINLRISSSNDFVLPELWKDTIEHQCRDIKGSIPSMEDGWSPLHVASARCKRYCIYFLLSAGADVTATDLRGRTPLDVAGLVYIHDDTKAETDDFLEVLRMLFQAKAPYNTMKKLGVDNVCTPLHISVMLPSLEGIKELMDYGAYPGTLNEEGETPLHLAVLRRAEDELQLLLNTSNTDPFSNIVDIKNIKDDTILETSVREEWISGVCLALEHGADIAEQSEDGETSLHAAATLGNIEILDEILSITKDLAIIDCKNHLGETALFKAVQASSVDCVKALLRAGSSVNIVLPGNVNILHKAAEIGDKDVLTEIIHVVLMKDKSMLDALTSEKRKGLAPLHIATIYNHSDCVQLLLDSGADVRRRTRPQPFTESTALHLCSIYNQSDVAAVILKFDTSTVYEVDGRGWFPIHTAGHNSSKDIIPMLLKSGADLSCTFTDFKGTKKTAIDLIVNNLQRPTDYLEDLFDSYISTNGLSLEDSSCEVTVDFSILMPKKKEFDQMNVITSLLNTGNRYGQKRLLLHPLIESFLHLKWKGLSPFFYGILTCYSLYVLTLTILVLSMFYYSDTRTEAPAFFNKRIWSYLHLAAIFCVAIEEFFYLAQNTTKYFRSLETWLKWCCIFLSVFLPFAEYIGNYLDWSRHVATAAILLAWTELMFMLSRSPASGYYVLMFSKVASNVMKILLLFLFLVIGFTISFMLQFFSHDPFENPWSAFVKTMVMMTSEFEYSDIFREEYSEKLGTTAYIGKLIFVLFLILASIVLMNLLIGVAVSDISDLEIQGNIHKLAKQVDFLGTLDVLVYDKVFCTFVPKALNARVRLKRNINNQLVIYPARPAWKTGKLLPVHIRDAILLIATNNEDIDTSEVLMDILNDVRDIKGIVCKDDEIIRELGGREKVDMMKKDLVEKLVKLADDIKAMKDNFNETNNRLDVHENSIKRIEDLLVSLDNKIDRVVTTKAY